MRPVLQGPAGLLAFESVGCLRRTELETRLKALLVMSVSSLASPEPKAGTKSLLPLVSRRRRKLLLGLSAALALSACGKKGDLELPPVEAVPADEPLGGDAE